MVATQNQTRKRRNRNAGGAAGGAGAAPAYESQDQKMWGAVEWDGSVPQRKGIGGGGRTSEFLDAVRRIVGGEGPDGKPDFTKAKPMVVPAVRLQIEGTNGQLESFEDAAKRITAKVHRKDALDFPITTRTFPDATFKMPDGKINTGTVVIYPINPSKLVQTGERIAPSAQTQAEIAGQSQAGANSPAAQSGAIQVNVPTPGPGQDLTVDLPNGQSVRVRHTNPAPAVGAGEGAKARKANRK